VQRFSAFELIQRRRRRRTAPARRAGHLFQSAWMGLAVLLSALLAAAGIGAAYAYTELIAGLPAVDALPAQLDRQNGTLLDPTVLYDRSGAQVLYTVENPGVPRRFLALNAADGEAFSPILVQSILAVMDPNFARQGALRLSDLNNPAPQTIAEYLVSDLLQDTQAGSGLRASLRLRLLANQAVTRYSKEQILEWYLNSAYFGHLAYGADSAAQLYLGKPASQLNLAEAALLAAALKAPALNPLDAPAAAREGQRAVLNQLLAAGAVDVDAYQDALNATVEFQPAPPAIDGPAQAFSQRTLAQLAEVYGQAGVERGGLRVITSLDYDLQLQTVCTLQAQLARLSASASAALPGNCPAASLLPALPVGGAHSSAAQASAVILDPQTGEVLALAGDLSADGAQSGLQSHLSGSLQTPLFALAGFARSLSPASLVWDIPAADVAVSDLSAYRGPLRLRTALANDYLNPLTAELLNLGSETLVSTAHSLGLPDYRLSGDTAATFQAGALLNPLEIGFAYSAFASLGQLNGAAAANGADVQPKLVLSVEDSHGSLLQAESASQVRPVVSQQLAYLVHSVLADESARWPSLGYPNALEIGRPAGAKTGTAQDGSTWAAGYTRQRLAVVWLGGDGLSVQPAAGIWHALMQYASSGLPALNWEQPAGISTVNVCDPSGLLPTARCPNVVSEVFLNGNEPTAYDNLYQSFAVNRETGRLATVFTPPELVENKTYLTAPPEAQAWASASGLAQPPSEYDTVQAPAGSADAAFSAPQQFSYVRGQVELRGSAAGAQFAAYNLQIGGGINPGAWTTLENAGAGPVTDELLGAWDTSPLADGLYVVRLQVVDKNQRVQTALLQVTVDNTPPAVQVLYPQAGQVSGETLSLQAEASDNTALARVEWLLDGRRLDERSAPPYLLVVQAAAGEHTLVVRAYDQAGNLSESQPVTFQVAR
jgi:membrane peptidoglycan carboxypeptidase